ncbi:Autoinducer 2 sensor kinase/phosphatase LuxQ [Gimesia maris]|jgi:signal transduction histidine kinase|uniref:histidine kinase n=1 Tax=Gimesia maris TaxID=122 RepID=A0A3D3QZI3_9PLAN|nr:ATP-binding protein [Gimesia maris]MAC53973.1 sensor histidine kinase [Gimesia sp.]QDT80724.1 Autoinducer 2 sensor kinase/phosphatase LuxQ [Gimesia maris]QDU16438.1 Autoinducer 2 sensor kinase/phosphatase LuxQ [Gimesia maris]HCO21991.1 sensor histidine kinase [Gimesia maris]|tara:strand:- start:106184 stop:107911 length:1728 start_codon:yes stop_codon:yes gene_type:complete
MSYRAFKKLLGETNLERKCRYLFGGGLLVLITASFSLNTWLNNQVLNDQNITSARLLVAPIILEKHWKWSESNDQYRMLIEKIAQSVKPQDLGDYSWAVFKANPSNADSKERPIDSAGYEALERIKQGENEIFYRDETEGKFQYYGAIHATESCVSCHRLRDDPDLELGGLIGIVNIRFPSQKVEQAQNWNNAINLASALVTAVLAMLAAYAIVRYVIVKPVLHLKDVSDQIAHGNLDLRADIRTGDEFEELSYAFNRMLRHLVTVQEELRTVNTDLDTKVDELAQVNLRLYEMNKLKDEFLATMSHELRTPLNSILGFSDLLANSKDLNEKQKRYVSNIQMSGKNLLAQINDVLDLAKIESGKMELQLSEITVADLIERRVGNMLPLADKKNIELTSEIDPKIPILFQDSIKIQQILNNLLSNAIKFTPEGGRVHVAARLCGENPKLMDLIVEDTGIGIPLDEQEHIFEKFRQGKSSSESRDTMSRSYEGTGLGLSIIRELSKLLDGEVFLESEFGRGSKFTARLPVRMSLSQEGVLSDLDDTSVGMNRIKTSDLQNYSREKLGENEHSETRTP